jgi:uncharacterized low-complexity protein
MRLGAHWHRLALAAVVGAGLVAPAVVARAAEASPATQAGAAAESCEVGQAREGKRCMHQIAPPGKCASARSGSLANEADGGECGIGLASDRFSPTDVAGGPDGFNPPPPGPPDGPDIQPPDNGGPPLPPPIIQRESPAPPDKLPGLP